MSIPAPNWAGFCATGNTVRNDRVVNLLITFPQYPGTSGARVPGAACPVPIVEGVED